MSIVARVIKKARNVKQVIDDIVSAFSDEVTRKPEKPVVPPEHRDARLEEWQLVTHIKLALDCLDDTVGRLEQRIEDARETLQTALKQTGHDDEGTREKL